MKLVENLDPRTMSKAGRRTLLASLLVTAVVVGVVALAGWLVLLFLKGIAVLVTYSIGAFLIVVPLLAARRSLRGRVGREKWSRIGIIAVTVAGGGLLCVVAHLVSEHGWLLIAVPAGIALLARLAGAVSRRRSI